MSIFFSRNVRHSNQDEIAEVEVKTGLVRQSRIRRGERFLKGPISMPDIATAARLPGQALAVFLAVHHQTALTKKSLVTLPATLLGELGISRDAKARALRVLEGAGLVTVARTKGRNARIQLTKTT